MRAYYNSLWMTYYKKSEEKKEHIKRIGRLVYAKNDWNNFLSKYNKVKWVVVKTDMN